MLNKKHSGKSGAIHRRVDHIVPVGLDLVTNPSSNSLGSTNMSIKRRTLLALTATAAIAFSSGATFADELMDRAKGDGLRVAFYNFAPYAYKDDSTRWSAPMWKYYPPYSRRWAARLHKQTLPIGGH